MLGGPIDAVSKAIKGGKFTFMELARLAVMIEPGIGRIVEEWDRMLPAVQKKCDLDKLCHIKELDPGHVMAVVGEAAVKFRDNAQLIVAALSLPAIVEKSIKVGMTTNGWRDRKFLMEHSRFLPVSQGTRIGIINKNTATSEVAAEQATSGAGHGLPTHESTIGDADDILQADGL